MIPLEAERGDRPAIQPAARRRPVPADAPHRASEAAAPVPSWLREAARAPQSAGDASLAFGAAAGALDGLVRRNEPWAGAWRHRLALAAAGASVRLAGRVEDEPALRDALLLTRPGGEVGPAGAMLVAWRRTAGQPASELLTENVLAATLRDFGLPRAADAARAVSADLAAAGEGGLGGALAAAVDTAARHGLGGDVGLWLAGVVLARRLGWRHAVPLPLAGRDFAQQRLPAELLAAHARAAIRAIDLSAELGQRAQRLLAVAGKLRARGAGDVVQRLLGDDAMVASARIARMSDRGMRRLFDRLLALGAVRELSGRPIFRIYGL